MVSTTREKLEELRRIKADRSRRAKESRQRKIDAGQRQVSIWLDETEIEILDKLCFVLGKSQGRTVAEVLKEYEELIRDGILGEENKEKYLLLVKSGE
jgi:hypothetical protein